MTISSNFLSHNTTPARASKQQLQHTTSCLVALQLYMYCTCANPFSDVSTYTEEFYLYQKGHVSASVVCWLVYLSVASQ